MRDEFARLVSPIFQNALFLRARLAAGETLNLNQEQANLKGMLKEEGDPDLVAEFGGDPGSGNERFLGARYFMTCWLDELFVEHSLWGKQWGDQPLEKDLYGTDERGALYWEQATRAETRPREDALEICFLCVMLGYRGSRRDRPEELQKWVDTVGKRVSRAQGKDWSPPAELDPPIQVAPLRGREKLRGVSIAFLAFLVAVVPPFAYLLYSRLMR
ncbi:MAG: DotU family type IV/VI secretion system protein [Gemmataceae bacterium]